MAPSSIRVFATLYRSGFKHAAIKGVLPSLSIHCTINHQNQHQSQQSLSPIIHIFHNHRPLNYRREGVNQGNYENYDRVLLFSRNYLEACTFSGKGFDALRVPITDLLVEKLVLGLLLSHFKTKSVRSHGFWKKN